MGNLGARYICRQARTVVQRGSDQETGRRGSHAWHGNLVSLRFNTDIASPLPRAGCHGQGTSTVRITHFTLATTSCLRPHSQHFGTAHLTTVEMLKLCEFTAGSLDRSCSQSSTCTLSLSPTGPPSQPPTLFLEYSSLLGDPHKKGPFRLREIACAESI